MSQGGHSAREKIKGFACLLAITSVLWLALTSTLGLPELIVGSGVCLIISLFGYHIYSKLDFPPLRPKGILCCIIYVTVLLWEIIKANLDVAYRVIHPKIPIKPGIVVIKTHLKSDFAKMILANSITLTPGTFTLDVIGDELLVHWINVKTEDTDEATSLIGHRFEKYLRIIFG
ncbi:MAG: Na+/H+ antiporter subunit E [Deltaproteobacteria bacterium]|nr:Na+/H+ antiporter subunit E [Deltaproteobacteria bacterium]